MAVDFALMEQGRRSIDVILSEDSEEKGKYSIHFGTQSIPGVGYIVSGYIEVEENNQNRGFGKMLIKRAACHNLFFSKALNESMISPVIMALLCSFWMLPINSINTSNSRSVFFSFVSFERLLIPANSTPAFNRFQMVNPNQSGR